MKNLFLGLIMLAGTASFASTNENFVAKKTTSEMTSIFSETTSEVKTSSVSNDDKWYMVTTITTTSYFLFGYWVGSSVTTTTEIVYISE